MLLDENEHRFVRAGAQMFLKNPKSSFDVRHSDMVQVPFAYLSVKWRGN